MNGRQVRPRLAPATAAPALGALAGGAGAEDGAGGACGARGSAAPAGGPPASPLLPLLEATVSGGRVVKDPLGTVYTGFASYSELADSACSFVPMNSNRAINRDVVRSRVQENVEELERSGRFLEFGHITLLIVVADPSHEFLVMDGQHRCEAMHDLCELFPGRDLWFQFRAKLVGSEAEAFEELKHFQRSYPTDARSFFRARVEARVASAVLERLKLAHRGAFREMILSDRQGQRTGDPPRPYLNDNLVFRLLQDAALCGGVADTGGAGCAGVLAPNVAAALARVRQMDGLLASLARADLGKGVTEHIRQTAARLGCWLGFFREGVLHWGDLERRLQVAEAPAAAAAAPACGAAEAKGREPQARAAEPECVVCLDGPPEFAILPCGHRCVCAPCAAAVRAGGAGGAGGEPPRCPVCRGPVRETYRIFV